MGEFVDDREFAVKEDGTIVRKRICFKCGKETFSNGDYCEYCGHKLPKINLKKGIDFEKEPKNWQILFMVLGTLFFGLAGIWIGYYFNSVVECDGILYYRFDKKTRQWGRWATVVSVLSVIIWSGHFF